MIDTIVNGKTTQGHNLGVHIGILEQLGVRDLLREHNSVVAGGFWRTIFDKSKIADIDIFCVTKPSAMEVIKGLESKGFKITFTCPQGELHTMRDDHYEIQVISKDGCFSGDPESLIDSFDFTACQFASNSDLSAFYTGETSVHDAVNRLLRINKLTFPAHSMRRSYKYVAKGYEMTMTEVLAMVQATAEIEGLTPQSFYKGGID